MKVPAGFRVIDICGRASRVVATATATDPGPRAVADANVSDFVWSEVTHVYRRVRHKLFYSIVAPAVKEVGGADAG